VSEISLFRIAEGRAAELPGSAAVIERALQRLFEANLEPLLGVRFLATEYSTGPVHGGRIDTLGLDEDGSPVIIEYKRDAKDTVINQGLFYLDWLMDHRGDFELLVHKTLGAEAAAAIDWSGPRLLCIAGDFTHYDTYAVKQIPRNIELLRYRLFDTDLLMIEMVHSPKEARSTPRPAARPADRPSADSPPSAPATPSRRSDLIAYRISQTTGPLLELFEAVRGHLAELGDDVQVKQQLHYVAFKRIKNFACLEVYPTVKVVTVFLKVDPKTVAPEEGFIRDMTGIGHFGTGDLQVSLRSMADFARAQPLFLRSYEGV
jgi:predicted transport protein